MKKLMLVAAASLFALSLSAQSAGELRLGGSIGFSSSSAKVGSVPSDPKTTFTIAPAAEYFVIDNLSVALELGYESEKEGTETSGVFTVSPELSYYIRLADNFYYNPSFYVGLGFGSHENSRAESSLTGFGVGLKLVRFDYAIAEHFALGFSCGNFEYQSTFIKAKKGGGEDSSWSGFGLAINVAPELSFQYIF